MALIPVQHPVLLKSAAEAEAFFGALRWLTTPLIYASGFHTTDFKRITRLIHVVDPQREHTISFQGGSLGSAARAALARVAELEHYDHFDVQTQVANLRAWPEMQSRVHSDKSFSRPFLDADVKVTPHGNDLETTSVATAVRAFFDVTDDRVVEGQIHAIKEALKPALLDFLRELQTTVHAALEIETSTARALTELYDGEPVEWSADGITVRFPEGRIQSFMTSPHTNDDDRAKLLARFDKALARAGIRHS